MKTAYISIGGNLGDRCENLRKALILIHNAENITLTKVSSFYETAPWGKTNQPQFLNAAVKVLTNLSPEKLLKTLQNIENIMGRERKEHWGERVIDIDIVHYEGENIKSEFLNLPHPFFAERNFVLVPLCEIEPNLVINDISIKTYLKNSKDNSEVKKTTGAPKDFDMTIIVAVDSAYGIGYHEKLLFKIKSDLKYFRQNTLNSVIIMGRKTFNETGALCGREIIVMSEKENFKEDNVCSANSLIHLFKLLDKIKGKKIFVCGGEKIYSILTPYATSALVTCVLDEKKADKFLPPLYDFKLDEMRFSEENGIKFAFSKYIKE